MEYALDRSGDWRVRSECMKVMNSNVTHKKEGAFDREGTYGP